MNMKRTNNYQPPLRKRNDLEDKRNVYDLLLKNKTIGRKKLIVHLFLLENFVGKGM